ncbi:hypothetical protein HaLaN_26601, partial [Haematococcus lacustris]
MRCAKRKRGLSVKKRENTRNGVAGIRHFTVYFTTVSTLTTLILATYIGNSYIGNTAFLGIAPRMDDDLSDMGFIANASLREEAGPHVWSTGQGTVHLRLQMLCKANIEASRRKEQMRHAAMQEYQQEGKETTGSTNGAAGGESAGLRQLRE